MSEAAVMEYSPKIKKMGDEIVEYTLKEAKELSDYLKDVHGIEPAAGGGVMMAMPGAGGAGGEAVEEQTEFDVVLESFGDTAQIAPVEISHYPPPPPPPR